MPDVRRKLGLGTVQFGLDYGVANATGKVPQAQVQAILALAASEHVRVLDTAAGYGDSESVLGHILHQSLQGQTVADTFDIVTKIIALTAQAQGDACESVQRGFAASLRRLSTPKVYGVLVHHPEDLLGTHGERLYALLRSWQAAGLVKKIGVSVYDRQQIDALFSRYTFDLVQVPVSILDQRLVHDGTLVRLRAQGVEVHARSIFLQGLLLMRESDLPAFFAPVRHKFSAYHRALDALGISPLAAALGFIKHLNCVDVALIGVQSTDHLRQCLDVYDAAVNIDASALGIDDVNLVDPRRWKVTA